MPMAERFINAFQGGTSAGEQQTKVERFRDFAAPAARGDQAALDKIYEVDPAGASALENHYHSLAQNEREEASFVQEQAGRVAYGVLKAKPEEMPDALLGGIAELRGITKGKRIGSMLEPQLSQMERLAQSRDPAAISKAMSGVLERSMSYADRVKMMQPKSEDERIAKILTDPNADPNSPEYRAAYAIWEREQQDRFIPTQQGIVPVPGKRVPGFIRPPGGGAPTPPANAAAPAAAPPAAGAPPAASMGGKPMQYGVPIEGTEKPLPSDTRTAIDERRAAMQTAAAIDADLGDFEAKIETGELELGPFNNAYAVMANAGWAPGTKSTSAYGSLAANLERLRNESLRLNTGVQTDGDAKRAWNELINNLGNEQFVLERLKEIRRINQRGARLQYERMQASLKEFGREAPPFEEIVGTASQGAYGSDAGDEAVVPEGFPAAPVTREGRGDRGVTLPLRPTPSGPPRAATAGERLGPLLRADVEAYAKQHQLSTEQAYRVLVNRLKARQPQQGQ